MYGLSKEDLEIQDRTRGFVDTLIPYEVEAEMNSGEIDPGVYEKFCAQARELGLTASNMPKELGGGGRSMIQQVLIQEQVGRVTNALAWCVTTPPSWFVDVATEYQTEKWLRPTVRGEAEECYAITEEAAGTDVDAIEATCRRDGEEYVLDGVKWHVTSYNEATWGFFQGKLTDGTHEGEHAMFIFDIPTPGVEVVRTPAYTHTIGHHHPIVSFENVRVPKENLVGEEGDGMGFAYEWFRFERFMVAARCLGGAERLTVEATEFAKSRIASGRPIIEYQLIQGMLADCLTELFAARSMLYAVAKSVDDGADVKLQHAQASMAKLYASEMANRVADRALQIFGGRGYMRENVAERFFRELRVERIWEGTSEIQRTIIAEQMAKRGATSLI
jgi:acyl-CoA dehydrogenase